MEFKEGLSNFRKKTVEMWNAKLELMNSRQFKSALAVLSTAAASGLLAMGINTGSARAERINTVNSENTNPKNESVVLTVDEISNDTTKADLKNPDSANKIVEEPENIPVKQLEIISTPTNPVSTKADDLKVYGNSIEINVHNIPKSEPNYQERLRKLRVAIDKNSQEAYKKRVANLGSGVSTPIGDGNSAIKGSAYNFGDGISSLGLNPKTFNITKVNSDSRLVEVVKPGTMKSLPDGLSHLFTRSRSSSFSILSNKTTTTDTIKSPTEHLNLVIGGQVYTSANLTSNEQVSSNNNEYKTIMPSIESPVVIKDGQFFANPRFKPEELGIISPEGTVVSQQTINNTLSTDKIVRYSELFGTLDKQGTGFVVGGQLSTEVKPGSSYERNIQTEQIERTINIEQVDLRGLNPQNGNFFIQTEVKATAIDSNKINLANIGYTIPFTLNEPESNSTKIISEPFKGSLPNQIYNDQDHKTLAYNLHNNTRTTFQPEIPNRTFQNTTVKPGGQGLSVIWGIGTTENTYISTTYSRTDQNTPNEPLTSTIEISQSFDSTNGQVTSSGINLNDSQINFNGQVALAVLKGSGTRVDTRQTVLNKVSETQIFGGIAYSIPSYGKTQPLLDAGLKIGMQQSENGIWSYISQGSAVFYPTEKTSAGVSFRNSFNPSVDKPNLVNLNLGTDLGKLKLGLDYNNYLNNSKLLEQGVRFDNSMILGMQYNLNKYMTLKANYDFLSQNISLSTSYADKNNAYNVGVSLINSKDDGTSLNLGVIYRLSPSSYISGDFGYRWDGVGVFTPSDEVTGVIKYNSDL